MKKNKRMTAQEKLVADMPKDYLLLQQSLQDFIPFKDIKDMMIVLPNHQYRAVIEVKPINYYLKTASEQETLEAQFKAAVSSWDFSFAFYTQTRTIDAEDIINTLSSDIEKLTTKELRSYGRDYITEMSKLTKSRNGNLIKKNYIILSCNDAEAIGTNQTELEMESYAFDKLSLNSRKIFDSLAPMGLVCSCLTNEELIELLFVAINKHSMLKAVEILDYTTNITTGPSEWDNSKVDVLLDGLVTQLRQMMLTNHDMSASEYDKAQLIIKKIEDIRDGAKEETSDVFIL